MQRQTLYSDGSEVPRGHCILPDHYLTTFCVGKGLNLKTIKRIKDHFDIAKFHLGYLTLRTLYPRIVEKALSLIDKEGVYVIDQVTIVARRRSAYHGS